MARRLSQLAGVAALLATLVVLTGTGVATAATPPNPNDPCAQAGRDSCGTTGVGSYHQYAFGLRWFGDYRGAIPGVSGATFCIDLDYWFPGRSYRYVEHTIRGLRNRNGTLIGAATLNRISYAIWNDGRSDDADQQAAVMLYVHGQIADAPAAETAGNSIGPAVDAIYERVTAAADRYAGPYRLSVQTPSQDIAGQSVKATVKVLSASGNAVPDVAFKLDVAGATGAPSTVTAGANGIASVSLTPTDTEQGLSLKATATGLAADDPTLYVPSVAAAAASGQRLIAPASESLSASQTAKVSLITPTVSSTATPASLIVGSPDADKVTIAGLPAGYGQTATVNVYGPAASQSTITCSGTPAADLTFAAVNGTTSTASFTPDQGGWYAYQVVLPGTASVAATTSPCAPTSESFEATLASPTVSSAATPSTLNFGDSDADAVTIAGLPTNTTPQATVNLYGPVATQSAISCSGTPADTVTFTAVNGTTTTPSVTPTEVGWYGYQVLLPATNASNGVTSTCAPATESFEVTTTPTVHTQVSTAASAPGTSLSDTVDVSGLQGQSATVTADLYGPYASVSAITCTGTPVWSGTVQATGDGTYVTSSTRVSSPGYYVYHESIAAQGLVEPASSTCADTAETTLATGSPAITTRVSDAVVAPGGLLQDHAVISGLGGLSAKVHVVLWGPYASASKVNCTGPQAASANFTAPGDGTYLTAKTPITQAGYYVYQESIAASPAYPAVATACADAAETSVAKPAPVISTEPSAAVVVPGRSVTDHIRVTGVGATPVRIGVKLYGPFATLSQLSCAGRPDSSGTVTAHGDGTVSSGSTVIRKVGFYVYRETVIASGLVPAVTTACADLPETVLGRPEIITGPGVAVFGAEGAPLTIPAAEAPTQISIPALQIQAPISSDTISVPTGQMQIPVDIHRVGWWQDGAAPADPSGTTLVFGHINHVNEGPGAFAALALAGAGKLSVLGDQVTVRTRNGKLYEYRITSVSRMPKANLPTSVFTKSGARKLVMVTCGGAYDAATHHYVDNIVVTAVPA
jgi:hypothetical protein